MLKSHNIKSVLSLPGKPQSNGNVERFNRTLKRSLEMAMKIKKTKDWPKLLPEIINNYNNTVHDTTGKTPNDLDDESNKSELKEVENKIKKKVTDKNDNQGQKFKVGDQVRRKLDDDEKKHGENWSKELFTIYKVLKPKNNISSYVYQIENKSTIFTKKYYNNDLLLIPAVENELNEPERYQISKLIKPLYHNKEPSYVVRWKGYTSKDDTIEPRKQLIEDVPKMIKLFEKDHSVVFNDGRVTWNE